MIRRLVEANYFANRELPTPEQLAFWFRELRTPDLLCEVAMVRPDLARQMQAERPLIQHALARDVAAVADALLLEEREERANDRACWLPLKQELERLRRRRV